VGKALNVASHAVNATLSDRFRHSIGPHFGVSLAKLPLWPSLLLPRVLITPSDFNLADEVAYTQTFDNG
jgi:hypothetical protein